MTDETKETIKVVGGFFGIIFAAIALLFFIGWTGYRVAINNCKADCSCRAEQQIVSLPAGEVKQIVIYPYARERAEP